MKIIKYTLTPEGTIPEYIVNGGHMPVYTSKDFPQNIDLIGIATDDAPEPGFLTKEDLLDYAADKNFSFKSLVTGEDTSIETVVDLLWNELGA